MATGLSRLVINCIESRLEKVVLPDDEGPEMSTMRVPSSWYRRVMSSAILLIFFSCRASATLMRSVAWRFSTTWFKSPMLLNPTM